MPKVSVIIPTHNRADLLKAAIQSVLDQTYTDFELLVCDDASNDHTQDTVAGFSDPRIIYKRYEKNSGVVELRNNAVNSSSGEYIAFLDDDDEWLPEKLEKQVSVLDRSSPETGPFSRERYFWTPNSEGRES
ncbi:MAG: glycosyltransferase family A protein [Thermodesulfobacteriota bacterium]